MNRSIEEQEEFDKGAIAAIDDSLAGKTPPPDPDAEPIIEPEPVVEADPEPVVEPEPDTEPEPEPEPEPDKDQPAGDPKKDDPLDSPPSDDPVEEPPADPKPSDEFGKLPEGTKKETADRFEKLRSGYDELHADFEKVSEQNKTWMETVQGTGTNPDQFSQTLEYLSDINKGTPESLERAYRTMESELQALAKVLGKEAPGVDPLSDYPDLKEKVDEGYLDRGDALEIIQARASKKFTTVTSQQAETQNAAKREQDNAIADIGVLGNKLRSDPQYNSKLPYLNTVVKAVIESGSPPSKWVAAIEKAYKEIPAVSVAPIVKKPIVNSLDKTVGGTGTGELNKKPGSGVEAIDMALDAMG